MTMLAKRLYKGTLGTGSITLYTVPIGVNAIVKNIVITNKADIPTTITLIVGGTEIIYQHMVPSKATIMIDNTLVINSSENITAIAGSASAINIYVTGIEVK